jgi:hypothetical protein
MRRPDGADLCSRQGITHHDIGDFSFERYDRQNAPSAELISVRWLTLDLRWQLGSEYHQTHSAVIRTFRPFTTDFSRWRSNIPMIKRYETKFEGVLAQ